MKKVKNISYILEISVPKPLNLEVGMLGKIKFEKGTYFYTGSGKKGLMKRLDRHLRKDKKIFWHIDYLTSHKDVMVKNYRLSAKEECTLARGFRKKGFEFVKDFGSSDCRCPSHLYFREA